MTVKHSSRSVEHYTPTDIVDRARRTVGAFDLDPASTAAANLAIGAARYYTREQDGFFQDWSGVVLLNPPGGVLTGTKEVPQTERDKRASERWKTKSSAVAWWRHLVHDFEAGQVTGAIFVGFTLELLQGSQDQSQITDFATPCDYPTCIPAKRIRFDTMADEDAPRVKGDAPPHGSFITLLSHDVRAHQRFALEFRPVGKIIGPACANP